MMYVTFLGDCASNGMKSPKGWNKVNIISSLFGPAVPHLDPQAAQATLKDKSKAFLLDVREPHEYREGHIAGATLIPLGQLPGRAGELPRDRQIVCVCRSGSRSGAAARQLIGAGFQAANLQGGMLGWARAGLPVKRGASK